MDINNDNAITLGNQKDEINMIVLISKTEKRAADKYLTIKKLIMGRTEDQEIRRTRIDRYTEKRSANLRKLRLKIKVSRLEDN